jgi:hypothetical protein
VLIEMPSYNALSPEKLVPSDVTGVNRLVDFVVQRVNPNWFPTAGRLFAQTAQGERKPITEVDYTPEELAFIRRMIELKGGTEGSIQYRDYNATAADERKRTGKIPMTLSPGIGSLADPLGNVQTSLGRFRYYRDENGNLMVMDSYDFNEPPINASQLGLTEQSAAGPYNMLRSYAGQKIPPGQGRSIRINLGQ